MSRSTRKQAERTGTMDTIRSFVEQTPIKIALVTGIGVSALTGCVDNEAPKPEQTTSQSPATPIETASPTPEVTSQPEAKVTVDYAQFDGWEQKDFYQRQDACDNGLFNPNLPEGYSRGTVQSNGVEIAEAYGTKLEIIATLYSDSSNPKNQEVAELALSCITSDRNGEDGGDAFEKQLSFMKSYFDLAPGEPAKGIGEVTRYSSDFVTATSNTGSQYQYKVVEYRLQDSPSNISQSLFEWNERAGWQEVMIVPEEGILNYGPAGPVVVDPSRSDAAFKTN